MDYEVALKQALAAANAQAAQQQMAANIEAGNGAYGQLKDQAAVSRGLERQRLAQRMADIGLGTVPQSLTVQNNSMMAGSSDIGDISRQNQNYAGMQNAMIAQANANAGAQAAGISAQMNAAQSAADLEDRMNEFDRYYRMYMAKKITARQFKAKTGMDVRGWPKPFDIDEWFKKQKPPQFQNTAEAEKYYSTVNYLNNQVESKNMTPDEAVNMYKQFIQGF